MVTNRVARIIGKVENTERFLKIALFQGNTAKKAGAIARLPGGADSKHVEGDPTLIAAAYQRQRFFLFTKREPEDTEEAAQGR
jgi:peptidylprolyl isomerase domain and WD repeat-containing protein 1